MGSDELFGELQSEAYSIMLFELFPRFYDACKEEQAAGHKSEITAATTLSEVPRASSL